VKQRLAATRLLTLTGVGGPARRACRCRSRRTRWKRIRTGCGWRSWRRWPIRSWCPRRWRPSSPSGGARGVAVQTLVHHLKPKRLLLVLDNCEHLLSACAQLAQALLQQCPHLRFLTSSRRAGHRGGSHLPGSFALPAGPRAGRFLPGRLAAHLDPVRGGPALHRPGQRGSAFLRRDQPECAGRGPGLRAAGRHPPGDRDGRGAGEGAVGGADQRADRGSLPAADRRQSHGAARQRRCAPSSIGATTCSPRPSAACCGGCQSSPGAGRSRRRKGYLRRSRRSMRGDGVEEWEVLDLLTALVDKSLVLYEEQYGETRYRLLETVRQYARDRLLEAGESQAVRSGTATGSWRWRRRRNRS